MTGTNFKRCTWIFLLLWLISSTAISQTVPATRPRPATRPAPVILPEAVGVWEYAKGQVRVTLSDDGTYVQLIMPPNGPPFRHTGRWEWDRLNRAVLLHEGMIHFNGAWSTRKFLWWTVVDSPATPGGKTLRGGASPDPDFHEDFVRVLPQT